MSDEMKQDNKGQQQAPQAQQDQSPTVTLFQKTHASLVTLQRIDEQLMSLAERRRKVQSELREAQAQLNEEIDRAAAAPEEVAAMKFPTTTVPRRTAATHSETRIADAA